MTARILFFVSCLALACAGCQDPPAAADGEGRGQAPAESTATKVAAQPATEKPELGPEGGLLVKANHDLIEIFHDPERGALVARFIALLKGKVYATGRHLTKLRVKVKTSKGEVELTPFADSSGQVGLVDPSIATAKLAGSLVYPDRRGNPVTAPFELSGQGSTFIRKPADRVVDIDSLTQIYRKIDGKVDQRHFLRNEVLPFTGQATFKDGKGGVRSTSSFLDGRQK